MSVLRDHECPCVAGYDGDCLTCGKAVPVRWESDWADVQSCSLREFLADNEESLSFNDKSALLALKPGEQVTVMGGACKVRRVEGIE